MKASIDQVARLKQMIDGHFAYLTDHKEALDQKYVHAAHEDFIVALDLLEATLRR